jgi:hypothetical protein
MDIITYSLSKKYIEDSLKGVGALKGKNCTISSIEPVEGGNKITFSWTLDDGTQKTESLIVMNGKDGSGNDSYTKEEIDEKISKAIEDAIIGDIDLSDYDTSEEVDEKISNSIVVPMYDEEDESIKFVGGSVPTPGGGNNTSGGTSIKPSATIPTKSTVGNLWDMLLVTTAPLRLYILRSIDGEKYNWTCIAGENVVFEDVEVEEEKPEDGDTRIPLELKLVTIINQANKVATTPYFDATAVDNVGDSTSYYTVRATCDEGYFIAISRVATKSVGEYATNATGSPSKTLSESNNKAPMNDYKYYNVMIRKDGVTNTTTNEQINDCVQNANAKIQVMNDQDVVIAEYKLVNNVEG